MGNLINPISLRLKYQGSWKLNSSQYFRKDFSYFFFLDEYIKLLLNSITYLKSFFKKLFFYELKYFIKNNSIFFFFVFRVIKRRRFVRSITKLNRKDYLLRKGRFKGHLYQSLPKNSRNLTFFLRNFYFAEITILCKLGPF